MLSAECGQLQIRTYPVGPGCSQLSPPDSRAQSPPTSSLAPAAPPGRGRRQVHARCLHDLLGTYIIEFGRQLADSIEDEKSRCFVDPDLPRSDAARLQAIHDPLVWALVLLPDAYVIVTQMNQLPRALFFKSRSEEHTSELQSEERR